MDIINLALIAWAGFTSFMAGVAFAMVIQLNKRVTYLEGESFKHYIASCNNAAELVVLKARLKEKGILDRSEAEIDQTEGM